MGLYGVCWKNISEMSTDESHKVYITLVEKRADISMELVASF